MNRNARSLRGVFQRGLLGSPGFNLVGNATGYESDGNCGGAQFANEYPA
jgi:hypothetical protein